MKKLYKNFSYIPICLKDSLFHVAQQLDTRHNTALGFPLDSQSDKGPLCQPSNVINS